MRKILNKDLVKLGNPDSRLSLMAASKLCSLLNDDMKSLVVGKLKIDQASPQEAQITTIDFEKKYAREKRQDVVHMCLITLAEAAKHKLKGIGYYSDFFFLPDYDSNGNRVKFIICVVIPAKSSNYDEI